jgi:hypothetical protein
MPLLTMNLTRQSQLVYNQTQQTQTQTQQTQTQSQSLFRLGSSTNRNMIPLLITGNKSCKTCGGK